MGGWREEMGERRWREGLKRWRARGEEMEGEKRWRDRGEGM